MGKVRFLIDYRANHAEKKRMNIYQKEGFKKDLPYLEKVMVAMKKYCAETLNADFIVVYMPDYETFKRGSPWHKEYFIKILEDNNIQYADFTNTMKQTGAPFQCFPYGVYGHDNERGYKLLAEFILANLRGRETLK